MAATAVVDGHFVNATFGEWDAFTDTRSGEVVKPGRKFIVNVSTPHDDDLVSLKADGECIDELRKVLSPATFGTRVQVVCSVNKYGTYIAFKAEVTPAAVKAA
jgi:hypothetical protein